MSQADVVMMAAFAASVLAGLAVIVVSNALRQRAGARIRQRLKTISGVSANVSRQKILLELARAQAAARRRRRRQAMGTLGYYLNRLDTVGGRQGKRTLAIAAAAVLLLAATLLSYGFIPVSWWSLPLALLVAPLAAVVFIYQKQVARFQLRFLDQLPEAMDMITRASQAGIPVTQSIRNVGDHVAAPLGPEFLKMGDGLLLGNDIQEVVDEAVLRIELPDFAFFAVCLALQRDTGGSLVEALDNLSAIIRARRDLRLKTKAMTAEGRLSGTILALLPFFIGGALYALNPDYISILFETPNGRNLLWTAGIMLALGVMSIRKIAKMEV
ncbi:MULTISPECIES: type II secretion system F family protein [unclassified Brenneria]|uniref:type II secretion system F family protein n=1 Tax=unclassified Brenneria TaxID=2634434 RepID=UPI0018F1068D|nr:type II secretion system F family protein [Brenneria sp. L3-3C-1]MBJ7222716.1 type II secretion system F family protein [Brenneria sp. L3-3C-1]MEE3643959.1 type II secretion system F family protein [Brenneria sp. L3_3C_1]